MHSYQFPKDALSYKNHHNLKIVWYEDLTTNFEREVEALAEFTRYQMSEGKMEVKECFSLSNIIAMAQMI